MKELIYNIPEALLVIFFVFLLSLVLDKLLGKYSAHFDADT